MKRDILLIMPALFIGGAEKQYRYIADVLAEDNNVTVLLLNRPLEGQEKQTLNYIEHHEQIKYYQLDGNAINSASKGKKAEKIQKINSLKKQYFWIKKYLKAHHVDIVMFSYVTQLLMVPLFKKNHVKVIFNERNTGRQICDKNYKIKLLKKCDKVIANSKMAAKYVSQKTGIDVEVVNNGIVYKSLEHKIHNNFVITIPARITPIKNQMIVLKALKQMPNKNNILVKFAGGVGDESYLQELNEYISDNQLNHYVSFLGFTNEMMSVYSETDVVILPSFEEGTPNVLLESYLYRIIPLASDIPMNRDCCIYDELLFDPNDADQLAKKIDLLYNQVPGFNVEDVLEKNRQFVTSNYSMERLKITYSELVSKL